MSKMKLFWKILKWTLLVSVVIFVGVVVFYNENHAILMFHKGFADKQKSNKMQALNAQVSNSPLGETLAHRNAKKVNLCTYTA